MDRQPKDYPEPKTDFETAWDPTGYYRRKQERIAQILPYLSWIFVASLAIVVAAFLLEMTMITTGILIAFGAGLVVGWNVLPQPTWVKNLYDRAKAKIVG